MDGIRRLGNQLAIEREPELQTLVSAAFVRLSQEAASKRCYPAMQQALASLDSVEALRPARRRACDRASAPKSACRSSSKKPCAAGKSPTAWSRSWR
jgi:hypothetical protein